jgi:hypothetical protein
MTFLGDLPTRLVEAFNRASWWGGECRVWDERLVSATFDRWLYLRMSGTPSTAS